MRQSRNNTKSRKGSALMLVLIFMTFTLMIGAAMLGMAEQGTRHSVASMQADRHYYAAESAAQLAVQMFMRRIEDNGALQRTKTEKMLLVEPGMSPETFHALIINHGYDPISDIFYTESEMLSKVGQRNVTIKRELFDDIYAIRREVEELVSAMRFNGNDVSVVIDIKLDDGNYAAMLYDNSDVIIKEIGDTIQANIGAPGHLDFYNISYSALASWIPLGDGESDRPLFNVYASSGGRTVLASLEKGNVDTASGGLVSEEGRAVVTFENLNGSGAYYATGSAAGWTPASGNIYAADPGAENYLVLKSGIQGLSDVTHAMTIDDVIDRGLPSVTVPGSSGNNATLNVNVPGRNYVIVNGNCVLNGIYPDLEYLEVWGNLTIPSNANVICANLKGVFVSGTMAINTGSTFIGKSAESASPYGPTNSTYGTNFLIEKGLTIYLNNSTVKIDWSRFFVQGGNIDLPTSGGNSKLDSNSMFIATKDIAGNYGKLSVTGGSNIEFSTGVNMIPQFYSEGDMSIYVHSSAKPYMAIFGSLSDKPIFTGATSSLNVAGLIVGNCAGAVNQRVNAFGGAANVDKIMDGGIFDIINSGALGTTTTTLTPGKIEIIHTYTINLGGLSIREITGETW